MSKLGFAVGFAGALGIVVGGYYAGPAIGDFHASRKETLCAAAGGDAFRVRYDVVCVMPDGRVWKP